MYTCTCVCGFGGGLVQVSSSTMWAPEIKLVIRLGSRCLPHWTTGPSLVLKSSVKWGFGTVDSPFVIKLDLPPNLFVLVWTNDFLFYLMCYICYYSNLAYKRPSSWLIVYFVCRGGSPYYPSFFEHSLLFSRLCNLCSFPVPALESPLLKMTYWFFPVKKGR